MEKIHGINQIASISYCELRSIRLKQPKHKFLVRKDFTIKMTKSDGSLIDVERCQFTCTNYYLNLVKNGILLVIDEIQNIKNLSDQLTACKALIEPIVDNFNLGGKSRVLLLSGSPIDKKIQTVHLFRCTGIMKSDKLRVFNPYTGEYRDQGLDEIRNYFACRFPKTYREYLTSYYNMTNYVLPIKDLESKCYDMFQAVLKKELSSSMPPFTSQTKIIKRNSYFRMDEDDLNLLHKGVDMLEIATNFNPLNQTVNHGHNGVETLMNIQRALVMIETSKIHLLARLASETLQLNETNKVVICVNYTETINDLLELLSMFNPLKLNGTMSSKNRISTLEMFQRPTSEYRLLIGNVVVCSTGIDLDDQDGGFKRFCFVNPNYSAIGLYQLGHRFHRKNTKSDAIINFVFGNSGKNELPILHALSKKGEIMRETVEKQAEFGIIFPGEYPEWHEELI